MTLVGTDNDLHLVIGVVMAESVVDMADDGGVALPDPKKLGDTKPKIDLCNK
jgi:hypothetical protein